MDFSTFRYINPLMDFGFKKIFGQESNKVLLIAFLNEIFQGRKHIADLEYHKTEHPGESKNDRIVIFDVLCTGDDGETFIIEVQRGNQKFFKKRAIYYASRQISAQSVNGQHWKYNFNEVYVVAILENFTLDGTPSSKYLHHIGLCDRESGKIFHDGYGFIFIELLNFTKSEIELETELDK